MSDEQRTEDQSPAAGAPVAENGASAGRPKKRSSRSRSRRSAREAVDRLVATLAGPAAASDAKGAETARAHDSSPEAESPPEERAADTAPDAAAGEGQPKKASRRRRRPRRRAKGQKSSQAGQAAAEEQQPEASAFSGPENKEVEDGGRDAGETAVSETAPPPAAGGDAGEEAKTAAPPQEGKKPGKSAARQNKSGPVLKLLINAEEPEECRIVLLEDSKVEAFHIETVGREKTKGNIYKGVIVAVEPSLQAAFVDFGTEKNGFLPFGDIHPEYYNQEVDEDTHWSELHIQEVIDKGQEVLVEVVKEAAGGKGAALTTYLSLPGRYLVLMPGSDSHGISRKLSDEERAALRKMVEDFKLPEGVGYIVRTASKDVTKTALQRDLRYLLNLWKTIKTRGQKEKAPVLLHREQDIVARYLRDHFSADIDEIIVDTPEAHKQVQDFLALLPASQRKAKVRLHKGSKPIFDHFRVETQIEQIFQPKVPLPSGGSIVINPTEALVAIDVNSGSTKDKDFEESIFVANMEAADELARQLRLRDLGGLIVVDFIDMRVKKHVREVEKKLRESMKRDKAKIDLGRISKFGLMQISRQRMGPPVAAESYAACPHCQGRGMVQTVETQVLVHLRKIQGAAIRRNVKRIVCDLPLDIATYMLNRKRAELAELEARYGVEIQINAHPTMHPPEATVSIHNERRTP